MLPDVDLKAPIFLISTPRIGESFFSASVVLLLEHTESGSMGLVLNHESSLEMKEFCESQNMKFKCTTNDPILLGGPVQPERAFILHDSEHKGPETEEVEDSVHFSYSMESLGLLTDEPPTRMRVFLGYAGWGPGQLVQEVSSGAWLLAPLNWRLVFEMPTKEIWSTAVRKLGFEPYQLAYSGEMH
jgi:putative transcriptional regulator